MTRVPKAALWLGVAGLVPFVWGALTQHVAAAAELGLRWIGPRFVGPDVQIAYGTVILAFMSGVLWGFATRAEGRREAGGYALSVLPALWVFFFVGSDSRGAALFLIAGFLGLLGLDHVFWKQGLAPAWWMRLRIGLTAGVVACLLATFA